MIFEFRGILIGCWICRSSNFAYLYFFVSIVCIFRICLGCFCSFQTKYSVWNIRTHLVRKSEAYLGLNFYYRQWTGQLKECTKQDKWRHISSCSKRKQRKKYIIKSIFVKNHSIVSNAVLSPKILCFNTVNYTRTKTISRHLGH